VWSSVAALTAGCGAATKPTTAGSGESPGAAGGISARPRTPSDPAIWVLGPHPSLRESSSFTARVTRLDCNSGITGHVLEPEIHLTDSKAIVTFSVAESARRAATCQANNLVPYEVNLGEPLGHRALIDGHCLPDGAAATTSWCRNGPARFQP
jgi:hypothetical protein